MAYKITDECISCGACAGGCPVDAIAEGDGKYEIDADACMDCGALDFTSEDDHGEVFTDVSEISSVREALEAKGYTIESADPEKVPSNYVTLENEDDIKFMNLLIENLEENEDIVNVWHNWEE